MLKKYKSKSLVSLNVVLPTGGNSHVSFNAMTGGGSVYYTDNVNIQKGLEGHPKFGKLFTLDTMTGGSSNKADNPASKVKVTAKAAAEPLHAEKVTKKVVEVKMSCNDDAKDYVADKFGVSRSKLRSRAEIEKVASENGVKIIWS